MTMKETLIIGVFSADTDTAIESRSPRETLSLSSVSYFAAHGGVFAHLLPVDAHLGPVVATSRFNELVSWCIVGAPADRGSPRGPVRPTSAT